MLLDCGHYATPDGIGAGYAKRYGTDETLCYDCADAEQVAALLTESKVVAYVSSGGSAITTWTGGYLGRVVGSKRDAWRYTPTGGLYHRMYVRAVDVHGQHWYGISEGNGMAVVLRKKRSKSSKN